MARKPIPGVNDLATTHPELAAECSNRLLPGMITADSHLVIQWHGACGHMWYARVFDRKRGQGCPYCKYPHIQPNQTPQWYPRRDSDEKDRKINSLQKEIRTLKQTIRRLEDEQRHGKTDSRG